MEKDILYSMYHMLLIETHCNMFQNKTCINKPCRNNHLLTVDDYECPMFFARFVFFNVLRITFPS